MANKKFSEFVLKTSTSDVSHIVGYNGAENVQITPANFVTTGGTGVFLPLAGGTMVGNTTHNDNVKSIYGTSPGNDLQIYHDSLNSYIQDAGTGDLRIDTNAFRLRSANGGESMITAFEDSAVNLMHNNITRLSTTSTGISVTGNVVTSLILKSIGADTQTNPTASANLGIALQNTSDTDGNFIPIDFFNSSGFVTARIGAQFDDAGDRDTDLYFCTRSNGGSLLERMRLDSSGRLGVATSSPIEKLTVFGQVCSTSSSSTSSTSGANRTIMDLTGGGARMGHFRGSTSAGSGFLRLFTDSVERMRLTTTGALAFSGATNYGTSGQVLTSNGNAAPTWQSGGGGGASSLNGLTDCLVDTDSLYVGEVPSGLSGNPQSNTVLGIDAGNGLVSGNNNTFIGHDSGVAVNNSANNVLIGWESGKAMTGTGTQSNVCIGKQTFQTVAGTESVVVGYEAGRISSTSQSAYIGYQAGWANSGNSNASLGYHALFGGGGGLSVGLGREAGKNNTSTGHVSVGYQAGFSNTSGVGNTNLGYQAGYSITTGTDNVNIGYEAGEFSTGSQNTFVGDVAGKGNSGNTTGVRNVAVGQNALSSLRAGERNTIVGANAGQDIQAGDQNTIMGQGAGSSITSGDNNLVIGYNAQSTSATVSNEITLGNASVTALRCQIQTIAALSDSRDKTNIQPSTYGLDFINKLNPVTFDWNMRDGAKVGNKDLGFIAQELQKLDDENLQLVYANNPDRLEASYGRLIPILVQAIKELKAEIELLKS